MNRTASKWLGAAAMLVASGMGLWTVGLPLTLGGQVAQAAAPLSGAAASQPAPIFQGGPIRRESLPPIRSGAEPLSGPASPFQALLDPVFGPNYRANTDPQSPNRAQQEPSIGVNPTNPLNVVASAKDERGGVNTKQTWIYTSFDGGVTWTNQLFPFSPAPSPFSSDPVINFADDGMLFATSLPYGGGAGDGIQVARSTDGGLTFSPGVHLPGTDANSDKEWTWIDNNPASPYYHRMYVAWRDFGGGPAITLNYSTDRGTSWSPAVAVSGSAFQFPMPVALPNGDVLVTYLPSGSQLGYRRSTDGGVSFVNSGSISTVSSAPCPPDNSGCTIWRMNTIPSTTVNRNNGTIVVTWTDGRTGNALIHYSRSTDNGATWSPAAQLAPPGVPNTYQVEPWVDADEQGIFHAIWYDDRENPNTSIFNIYYSQSTDNGATWSQAVRISTATSDLRIGIPTSYGGAAGDYIQVSAAQGNVYAAWTDTRSGTGEDIYVVRGIMDPNVTPTIIPTFTALPSSTATPNFTSTSTVILPTLTSTLPVPSNTSVPPTFTATSSSTSTAVSTATTAATSTASATVTSCLIQFSDVPSTDTFYSSIRCLACRGIVSGYSDGTFRPNNQVTRGQLAKMVSNAAGFSEAVSGQTFEDVPPTNTFYEWIERLTRRGHMTGYLCGGPGEPCTTGRPYFRPFANATRGQTSKIVSNAAGFTETPSDQTFEDVPPTHTFYEFIQRLASRNVMQGYACGRPDEPCVPPDNRPYFRPQNDVTRGQSAKIVANTFFPDCQTP